MKFILNLGLVAVLYLFLFIQPISSVCSGFASSAVPAVVTDDAGESGYLIPVSLTLIAGHGKIYIPTKPVIGLSTQSSVETAVKYAFLESNRSLNECDVLVKIEGKGITGHVEGPSAGAAFSLLTYAALNNLTFPADVTMTGAVDEDGRVLRVGGLYEKLKMAANNGIKYFLSPINTLSEKVLLKKLENQYGVTVLEVKRVNEAIGFVFYDEPIENKGLNFEEKELPALEDYNVSGLEFFRQVATKMIKLENETINSLPQSIDEFKELEKFFSKSVEKQVTLLSKGYLFTAANDAFLNYIDSSSVSVLDDIVDLDLKDKKKEIMDCINKLEEFDKTQANFELLAGADIRKAWALTKIEGANLTGNKLADEKYFEYNELMYADAWCHVSDALRETAIDVEKTNKSSIIDEGIFKELAQDKLQEVEKLNVSNEDLLFHLSSSKYLFDRNRYAASIYDSIFVIENTRATKELTELTPVQVNAEVDKLSKNTHSSIWGRLYSAHAYFLAQNAEVTNNFTAYKLFKFANGLEDVTLKMKILLANETVKENQSSGSTKIDFDASSNFFLCGAALILAFVLVVVSYYLSQPRSTKK